MWHPISLVIFLSTKLHSVSISSEVRVTLKKCSFVALDCSVKNITPEQKFCSFFDIKLHMFLIILPCLILRPTNAEFMISQEENKKFFTDMPKLWTAYFFKFLSERHILQNNSTCTGTKTLLEHFSIIALQWKFTHQETIRRSFLCWMMDWRTAEQNVR